MRINNTIHIRFFLRIDVKTYNFMYIIIIPPLNRSDYERV